MSQATCAPDITINLVAESPCCAWEVVITYSCAHRLHRLYPDGRNAVLLSHPVRIESFGAAMGCFIKDGYNSHITIPPDAAITINGEALDTADLVEYLRNDVFCCQCHTQQNSPQYRCYPVDEEGNIIIPEPETP